MTNGSGRAASGRLPKAMTPRPDPNDGFGITAPCKEYLYPLIKGEAYPPYNENGMPEYVTMRGVAVPRKLANFEL